MSKENRMNLILLNKDDFISSERVRVTGRRHHHAHDVLHAVPGSTFQVGLLGGKIGIGTVVSICSQSLEMDILLEREPPEPLPMNLILAMPRPKVFRRVLQSMAALGVKRIVLLNCWRVDKSYWQSPFLAPLSIREQLLLGLEQGRDTILPTVDIQTRFKPFVEDTLPVLASGTCALVAHPQASRPCPAIIDRPITLAVGPEGGFTDYEVEQLTASGLSPVHLGKRSLRVETALPALIGRLLHVS
jgi:RsmE family RNA methyltransferase